MSTVAVRVDDATSKHLHTFVSQNKTTVSDTLRNMIKNLPIKRGPGRPRKVQS